MLARLALLLLAAGAADSAAAQCTGVTTPPGMGLSAASFGPVMVSQAYSPGAVTPAPMNVGDCSGDLVPDLEIPWSGAGAEPPATFSFSEACPGGADYVIVTFSGSATTWSAHDADRAPVNSASFPAGTWITMNLPGPKIDTLTVNGIDLCIHQVCWGCATTSSPLTLDFEGWKPGTLITNQFQPQGVVFDARSAVRIVDVAEGGTQSGTQALEVAYRGDPPRHAGPMSIRFLAPQRKVRVHVGQHAGRNPAASEAVLRVFDAAGNLLAREYARLGSGPSPITEPLAIDAGENVIERVEVQYLQRKIEGRLEIEVDTGGIETIDDLSFERAPIPPPPPPREGTCLRSERGVGFFGVHGSGECGDYLTLSFTSGDAGKLLTSAVFDVATAELASARFDGWGSPCGWIEPAAVAGHSGVGTQTLTVDFAGFSAGTEVALQIDLDRDTTTGGTVFAAEFQGATVTATFNDGEVVTATYGTVEDAVTITADSCAPLAIDWERFRDAIAHFLGPLPLWIGNATAAGTIERDAAALLGAQLKKVEAALEAVEADAGPDRLRDGIEVLSVEIHTFDGLVGEYTAEKMVDPQAADYLHSQARRAGELAAEAVAGFLAEVCAGRDRDGDRIPDCTDNCPDRPDPLQEDANQDHIGDVCQSRLPRELCDGVDNDDDGLVDEGFDRDLDGIRDCADNCPANSNPLQEDGDGDGEGDACEARGSFVRGDTNGDRVVNITDPIQVLNHLFLGELAPACLDAADANDDGLVNITDGIGVLGFLFTGGKPPAPPFPAPGVDATPDLLPCGATAAPIDPRLTKALARVQLNHDLGLNQLTLSSAGRPAGASELDGHLRLRLEPDPAGCKEGASCPAALAVEALHFRARSLSVGEEGEETGRISIRLGRTKSQRGAYDPDSGRLAVDVSLEVVYEALRKFPDHVEKGEDLRGARRPLQAQARLTGQVLPGGVLEARMNVTILEEAAILNQMDIQLGFSGPWTIEGVTLDPDFELGGDVYRLKIGIVADDALGTNAVLTPGQVEETIQEANEIWSQCCIQFLAYGGGPDGVTYIPSSAFGSGDGNLFQVEKGSWLPSPEERFLFDYDALPETIEVVFSERFVIGGVDTFLVGVTRGIGDEDAAIIVETENFSPAGTGYVLAHELGHALGLFHSEIPGNLMTAVTSDGGPALTPEQCEEAQGESPIPHLGYICDQE